MKALIADVEQRVREKFSDQEGSHDWFHIDRVRKNALLLQQTEGGDATIIELAALLHDFSDAGSRQVFALLKELNAPDDIANKVAQIVAIVSFKGALVEDLQASIEGQIVRDADRLDAIGAIGIARAFSYGGSRSRALYDPEQPPTLHNSKEAYAQDKGHTVNHFYEKLLLLKDRMQTPTAKALAAERHEYMLHFLAQFKKEWAAENPDTLL